MPKATSTPSRTRATCCTTVMRPATARPSGLMVAQGRRLEKVGLSFQMYFPVEAELFTQFRLMAFCFSTRTRPATVPACGLLAEWARQLDRAGLFVGKPPLLKVIVRLSPF